MRIRLLRVTLMGFVLVLTARSASGQKQDPCKGDTQYEMNNCAAMTYQKADAELNRVYQLVLKKYAGYDQFIQKLKAAQKAWVAFRDAHIQSLYFEDDKLSNYGSVWPMCWSGHSTGLTIERTAQLKEMLDPMEGDVCGSFGRPTTTPGGKNTAK